MIDFHSHKKYFNHEVKQNVSSCLAYKKKSGNENNKLMGKNQHRKKESLNNKKASEILSISTSKLCIGNFNNLKD